MAALAPAPAQLPRLYHDQTFDYRGHSFRVRFEPDDSMGAPWKEHDGHGVISDWTRRDKAPGERVLAEDRGSRLYYDIAKTMKIARRDQWGCPHYTPDQFKAGQLPAEHPTRRAMAACAVDRDFDRMRAWCADQWAWCGVVVELVNEDEEPEGLSLWCIENDDREYMTSVAYELADQIIARIEVAEPDVVRSNN